MLQMMSPQEIDAAVRQSRICFPQRYKRVLLLHVVQGRCKWCNMPPMRWLHTALCWLSLLAPLAAAVNPYVLHYEKEADRYGVFYRNSYGQKGR